MAYMHVFSSIAVLTLYFTNNNTRWWLMNNNNDDNNVEMIVWTLFTVLFLIINTAVALLITQLLFFHLQLHNKQITTYEYIIQDNAKRRDKERCAIALENKRRIELQNLKNNNLYKLQLQLGAFTICKCIDPFRQNIHHTTTTTTNTTTTNNN